MNGPTLLRQVEVDGAVVDVLLADGRVAAIGAGLDAPPGTSIVGGDRGALIPGLHDHHLHVLATAAARDSVHVGPDHVRDRAALAQRLSAAAHDGGDGWVRAVGYHESVAGPLDRHALDRIVADRPVRVQDSTGITWTLNSAALAEVGLLGAMDPEAELVDGVERGADRAPTGRLFRLDRWLGERLARTTPDLAALGSALAAHGITGATDTSPVDDPSAFEVLAAARRSGALPQRVVVTGGRALASAAPAIPGELSLGPVKVVLDDHDLPGLDDLVAAFVTAHELHRTVAVHCVTVAQLILALAAWDEAGSVAGDRIEHGSVIPPDQVPRIAALGLTVVTQPGFVAERGDRYLREVDPSERGDLYRCGSLLAAGVPVAAGSDAPYASIDPWSAMRAAVRRETRGGRALGAAEAVDPARALALFLGDPRSPGGPARRVEHGTPADLVLLAHPIRRVLERLDPSDVRWVCVAGAPVFDRR